jgi:hypothetical protein
MWILCLLVALSKVHGSLGITVLTIFLKNPLIAVQTGSNQTILRELDNSHACKNTDWDDKLSLCVCMYIGFCVQLCVRNLIIYSAFCYYLLGTRPFISFLSVNDQISTVYFFSCLFFIIDVVCCAW